MEVVRHEMSDEYRTATTEADFCESEFTEAILKSF